MEKLEVTIKDLSGLHARPLSLIVQVATKFTSDIFIHVGPKKGNLKSIMNVMALGIEYNQKIIITAEGEDEAIALKSIKELMLEKKLI